MRRVGLGLGVALALMGAAAAQNEAGQPPHAWVFGSWTGGNFPATDTEGARCTGQPTVIFTRDVVMRSSAFDVAYRQRLIETVAASPDAAEFRFVPFPPQPSPFGPRVPPDIGFGCGSPNLLRVRRIGPDEIAFPDCAEYPLTLKRCSGR